MCNQRNLSVLIAVLTLIALAPGAASGIGWQAVTVPNGNFETSGGSSSWSDGGTPGLSGTGILPSWQFAAGPTSCLNMDSGARVNDTVDYATHGQVAQINFHTNSRKQPGGYITSEPLSVNVGASRYKLDLWYRATTGNYGVNFGFMYGAIGSQADVTTSWLETPSNNKWGAPYEVNAGHNTRLEGERASWVHMEVYWDNTGTSTETFGLRNSINYFGIEGSTTPETLPDGTVTFAYYTNQRGLGDALRAGSYCRVNSGSGSVFLDDFQVSVEANQANLTVKKFFDCNLDNVKNGEDIDLAGWQFNVSNVAHGGSYNQNHTTDANGEIVLLNVAPGDYDITETIKGTGWVLAAANPRTVTVAMGNNVVDFGNQLPGDANQDEKVNLADFTLLKAHFGEDPAGWTFGNFNTDTTVNLSDFTILKAHFGEGAPSAGGVPEPASAMLILVGALAVLRRRTKT